MKFNLGDIVRGKKDNGYGITNHEAYMRITGIFPPFEDGEEYEYEVLVLKRRDTMDFVGETFTVEESALERPSVKLK